MEEKFKVKKNNQVKESTQKLSYEQLEAAAKELAKQADSIAKENIELRKALNDRQIQMAFTELDFRFKVLANGSFFSDSFIASNVKEIQNFMTPKEEESKEEKDGTEG